MQSSPSEEGAQSAGPLPGLPQKEERQRALQRYQILDTPPEKHFDQIARTAVAVCGVPTALIALIDGGRLWFKSCIGFDRREVSAEGAFCAQVARQKDMLVVEDATNDPRFREHPLVAERGWRFYAGTPLVTPGGVAVGALAIVDRQPRIFDAGKRTVLEDLAEMVVSAFERRSAEAQHRRLFEATPRALLIYDPESLRIVAANEAAVAQYGYAEDEFREMSLRDLYPPGAFPPRLHTAEGEESSVVRHRRKDDTGLMAKVEDRPLSYEGAPCRLLLAEDITERLNAEQGLRGHGEKPQALLDHLPEAVFEVDVQRRLTFAGGDWEALTGRPAAESEGESLLALVHADDRDALADAIAQLPSRSDRTMYREVRLAGDGAPRCAAFRARLHPGRGGQPPFLAGTLADLAARSERPAPEPKAPKAPKAYQIERHLGGEAGAPRRERPDAPDELGTPKPKRNGAGNEESATSFDLSAYLREELAPRKERARERGLALQLELPSAFVPVTLPKAPLRRVIDLLVTSAIDHTDAGSVTIGLDIGQRHRTIRIIDTGEGFTEEEIAGLFDENGGPGDGADLDRESLRAARHLARRLNGHLEVDSAKGHGTVYDVWLPHAASSSSYSSSS